jgi:hypothetical protein
MDICILLALRMDKRFALMDLELGLSTSIQITVTIVRRNTYVKKVCQSCHSIHYSGKNMQGLQSYRLYFLINANPIADYDH